MTTFMDLQETYGKIMAAGEKLERATGGEIPFVDFEAEAVSDIEAWLIENARIVWGDPSGEFEHDVPDCIFVDITDFPDLENNFPDKIVVKPYYGEYPSEYFYVVAKIDHLHSDMAEDQDYQIACYSLEIE